MNNKGQSLVLFVMAIPIAFLILSMVYNIGRMVLLKNELNNINNLVINYGLDNMEDEDVISKMQQLVIKNKSDIDKVDINIEEDKIFVTLEDSINTKISIMGVFKINSSYVGYFMGETKRIEKE